MSYLFMLCEKIQFRILSKSFYKFKVFWGEVGCSSKGILTRGGATRTLEFSWRVEVDNTQVFSVLLVKSFFRAGFTLFFDTCDLQVFEAFINQLSSS